METKVKLNGIVFKNPVIAASGTFGFGKEFAEFYPLDILGGISVKGMTLKPRMGNTSPRIAETASGILNSVGLQNPGVDYFIQNDLPYLKEHNVVIIANIAGNTIEDYVAIAEKLSETNVDMIEMNISCPNVKQGGIAFGIEPASIEKITSYVRRATTKPLMVKLSPNVANIADNARAAEAAGADSLSLINTITGMAVDVRTRKPILANVTGGLSGPAVKPIALRMVHEVYRAVKIPIVGMGGIMSAMDVFEFLLCGATAVQVGTANLSNPLAAKEIVEEIPSLMAQYNIEDVNEIIGQLQV